MTRRSPARSRARVAAALVLSMLPSLSVAACSGGSAGPGTGRGPTRGTTTITVSAAASLSGVFDELARDLGERNPSVRVALNFGSSAQLASQLTRGAPADVVAFANTETMDSLLERGLVDEPQVFATNRLAIVVPPGNPGAIAKVGDLAGVVDGGGVVALCAEQAPCGRYADRLLGESGTNLDESGITRAADARATLTSVSEGDADAAIVYATDARSAGASVDTIAIPASDNVVASYPIAVVGGSAHRDEAGEFVALTLGGTGRAALERAGFGPP